MSAWSLVLAGLVHYRRTHLGVVAGFAVAAAVLVGALLVGDSVRGSLRAQALARVGGVDAALVANDRTVRATLAAELEAELGDVHLAPTLVVEGLASTGGGARRADGVRILGVDGRFFALAPGATAVALPAAGEVVLNARLAARLEAAAGDEVLLRVPRPSALPRDMILATTEDSSLGIRARVASVVGNDDFGGFALSASPLPPSNAFVDLAWLQEELELPGRANLILAGHDDHDPDLVQRVAAALRTRWSLDDAELVVEHADGRSEVRTPRVFLDDAVAHAAASLGRPALGLLTYFVNSMQHGERATPYSMVTALGPLGSAGARGLDGGLAPGSSGGMTINEWLAEDLGAGPGDPIELRYWVPGPDRRLAERTVRLAVERVVPLEGLANDPTLMPPFPGLADEENCRDWETGVPVDLETIRDKDEAYWDDHRGTPKAFVTLEHGQELWGSRFGSLTAIRVDDPGADVGRELRAALDPTDLGLFFRDLRAPALAGSATPNDFGGLFLALSFFLLAAALLLGALLFVFGVEQRASEIGLLLAVGFPPRRVKRLLLGEAAFLAAIGCVMGSLFGVVYTRVVIRGLATVWQGAVASNAIEYHAQTSTLIAGALGAWLVAIGAARWALRGQVVRPAVELLSTTEGVMPPAAAASPNAARWSVRIAVACLVVAIVVPFAAPTTTGPQAAGVFFSAGSALLVGALAGTRWILARRQIATGVPTSVGGLGVRNGARRPGRSLAVAALLASGTFLVVSIGVHRKSATLDASERASGTGGFALLGRSTLPVHHDLNTDEGRDAYGLTDTDLAGVAFVSLRVQEGDEASCLNLGAPQAPRIVGVRPEELAERGAFQFAARPDGGAEGTADTSPWLALAQDSADGAIPAIGDAASVTWSLHKAVGDTLDYVDERGRPFQVRIVGTVADSVLQGNLLVSEEHFRERFPGAGGYRMFLVDAPAERADEVSTLLSKTFEQEGLALVPAAQRQAEFQAVQNTYLDIFQVLGALGVLLGSLGLGVVVLRNALERRRELSVLSAMGYSRGALRRLLAGEHGFLLALGWGAGVLAALLALVPIATGAVGGGGSVGVALRPALAVLVNGAVWVGLASFLALRLDLLRGLRNE